MIYFTADLHFYHEKIIRHCNRPFGNTEEMNEKLIRNWNSVVKPNDEVYVLGDVTMKGVEYAYKILSRLQGRKFLIRGNHDYFVDELIGKPFSWEFEWIKDYHELVWNNQQFVLFHYPIAEWNGIRKGAIHLHGHQHNLPVYNYQQKQAGVFRYDVGVDANNFTPVSIDSIVKFFA